MEATEKDKWSNGEKTGGWKVDGRGRERTDESGRSGFFKRPAWSDSGAPLLRPPPSLSCPVSALAPEDGREGGLEGGDARGGVYSDIPSFVVCDRWSIVIDIEKWMVYYMSDMV